jgi:undecaprenyl-diphosphatase
MTQDKRKASAIARLVQSRRAMLVLVAVLVFIWLLFEIKTDDIMRLDAAAYSLVVMHMRTAWLTPIMQSISDLAYPVVLVVMLLVIEVFAPGRRPGLCAAVNLVLATLLNLLLKTLVQRPRPEGYRLVAESGFSFPSGHSMVAMAFYGLLIWMVWRYEKDALVRRLGIIGFGLVIVLVGLSRIYLGVHYASDVLAGFCASIAWLGVYTKLLAPIFLTPRDGRRTRRARRTAAPAARHKDTTSSAAAQAQDKHIPPAPSRTPALYASCQSCARSGMIFALWILPLSAMMRPMLGPPARGNVGLPGFMMSTPVLASRVTSGRWVCPQMATSQVARSRRSW